MWMLNKHGLFLLCLLVLGGLMLVIDGSCFCCCFGPRPTGLALVVSSQATTSSTCHAIHLECLLPRAVRLCACPHAPLQARHDTCFLARVVALLMMVLDMSRCLGLKADSTHQKDASPFFLLFWLCFEDVVFVAVVVVVVVAVVQATSVVFDEVRFVLLFVVVCEWSTIQCSAWEVGDAENIKCPQSERILVIVPHPDDEALCCSGIIYRAILNNMCVRIVIATNGEDLD